jgi:hypothetical protein
MRPAAIVLGVVLLAFLAGAGVTVLDGGGLDQVLVILTTDVTNCCAAHVIVRGLTIRNGFAETVPDGGSGLSIEATANATIQDCAFVGNTEHGSDRGAGAHVFARNARLERSVFLDNQGYPLHEMIEVVVSG